MEDKVEKRPDGLGIEPPRWLQEIKNLQACEVLQAFGNVSCQVVLGQIQLKE